MLIDAHTHLDRYGEEISGALEEIRAHRIISLSNSMDIASYKKNVEISVECELVIPAFGVHPWNAPSYADQLELVEEHIQAAPILGEVGLDHFFVEDTSTYPAQQRVLEHFLAAAVDQNKLVCLHTKGAEDKAVETLRRFKPERIIIHWYFGPLDILDDLIALGAYFTVGVELLHCELVRRIAQRIPRERLLTETDNPGGWLSLSGENGKPAILVNVAAELARTLNITLEELKRTVQANFLRLIGDDPLLSERIPFLES